MLFGGDGFADSDRTLAGESGIKVNLVRGILKSGIEVGGNAGYAVGGSQGAELFLATTDEDGIGHNDFAWFDLDAALFTDGDDGADEVLIGAHAASDAVHDNADFMFFHIFLWLVFFGSGFFCALGLGPRRKGGNIDACFGKGAFELLFPMGNISRWAVNVDHSQGFISRVGQLVKNFGRNEDGLARSNSSAFFAETHFSFSLDDEVNFFLLLVVPRNLASFGFEGDVAHGKVFCLDRGKTTNEVLSTSSSGIGTALDFVEVCNDHSLSPKKVRYGFPSARRSR